MKNFGILLLMGVFVLSISCTKKQDFKTKVINQVVGGKIKGFDPIQSSDTASSKQVGKVYEGLLQYDYLKRPYELIPALAEAMPKVSNNGLTYTFNLKKGVMFHDDPSFPNGKGREVKASDVVYSIKRLADSKNVAAGWWLLDGKIKGLNEWRERNSDREMTNYNEEVEGLKALSDYTVQFTLSRPFPQFLYSLAMSYTYVVPKEAVEKYGPEFINHPVGTGPFMLESPFNAGSNKLVFIKNPNYRDEFYPTTASEEDKKAGLLTDAGKKLPLVDKIVVNIQTEGSTQWLNFDKGKTDYLVVPKDNFDDVVMPGKGVTDKYAKRGVDLYVTPDMEVTYMTFNHDMELFQNEKLKQAMSLAFDRAEYNKLILNGRGVKAMSPTPPGVAGNIHNLQNEFTEFDLEKAKKLLAEAGYPGGKGLPVINYELTATTTSTQAAQLFQKNMKEIGVTIKLNTNTWPQLTEKIKKRKAMMWGIAWIADYPDAENFLQLFYGPNSSPGANGSNFNDPWFNMNFKKASMMQSGPERTSLYEKLNKYIAKKVPWILGFHRKSFVVKNAWLKNYKFSSFPYGQDKFLNVDLKIKKEVLPKL
jgi:oligopeptide transport system substrate-binding protein